MGRKIIFIQWIQICAGLLIFALGVHLTIYANLGLAPWDCLGMGISYHTPLNYGLAMTGIALAVLVIDLLLGEKLGFGTVIDALCTGNFVQMFNWLNPLPENNSLGLGLLCLMAGMTLMALGMAIYMKAGQGCGPKDMLLVAMGKRMPMLSFGLVEVLVWAVVLLAGWLLGGPVGFGTVITTFGAGLVMQGIYSAIRFEPRSVMHRSIGQVLKELSEK